jgi:DNA-binding CsgD family transcriptional regulator
MSDDLKHYGMARRSGRYPWGSGQDPYQRAITFRSHIQAMKAKGMSELDIARSEDIKISQLRARMSLTKTEQRNGERTEILRLKDKGYSNMEIARRMSDSNKTWNESSVRSLLDPILAERSAITMATANVLKESADKKRYIDIGVGVENYLGVSRTKLNTAVAELEEQGYKVHKVNVEQLGMPGKFTTIKILGAPDTEWKEVVKDVSKIQSIDAYSNDFGRTYNSSLGLKPVENVDAKRVQVRFSEDGGSDKDGVMELRRGVKDLDLGGSQYAQVRIAVNGTHFLKGMAIYNDDMPKGVDIVFNTNKSKDVPMMGPKDNSVLKPMKSDPDNPFGATIKPGGQRGAINIVNEEGDWDTWSKTISSQILSKQTVPLAKKQLELALKEKQEEYEEIMSLTNPVVKKQLLLAFGDDCDSSAVHLKAAALPRQASKVILPVPSMKPTEVYAPTFNNGEAVVLIRHPHGGTFEIPQLIVNNKSRAAQAIMKNAPDAIGLHPDVAKKMSGADFDGDAAIVIPNNKGQIKSSASLKGLENFDPIESYKIPEGSKVIPIKPKTKQTEMGKASNLITDMTIKGANLDEIARAVRHSMVVIDSEKHNLDYRQSYIDHGIASLAQRYQNKSTGGAATLVSRASSEIRVDARKPRSTQEGGAIDPATGTKMYTKTGESYVDKKGRTIMRKTPSTKMAEETDAFKLSSGRPIEEVYAAYANNLKKLGNDSRKNALSTIPTPYSPSAFKVYEKEVLTLTAKLNNAIMNKPIERQASILANSVVERKKQANPNMDHDDLKKIRNQALAEARTRTGAKKHDIQITDKEWEAIQAGAVSPSRLTQILQNTSLDRIKQLATPRTTTSSMSATRVSLAKARLASGYTQAEVAESLGISTSTLANALK